VPGAAPTARDQIQLEPAPDRLVRTHRPEAALHVALELAQALDPRTASAAHGEMTAQDGAAAAPQAAVQKRFEVTLEVTALHDDLPPTPAGT
jgi:hypothetical protein